MSEKGAGMSEEIKLHAGELKIIQYALERLRDDILARPDLQSWEVKDNEAAQVGSILWRVGELRRRRENDELLHIAATAEQLGAPYRMPDD